MSELLARARRWQAEDPDPDTAAQLRELIDAGDLPEIADAFAGTLQFGTAGLRGRLGPGPNRMNLAVVRRAAAGLAAHVGSGRVVIGYDARHKSDLFARDTARVMAGAGLTALLLPQPLPTPVLAFAVRHLGCAAGVMVTASHNPACDNGFKVYLADGAQIAAPTDAQIAARIDAVTGIPLDEDVTVLDDTVLREYVAAAAEVAGPGPRDLRLVFTALHGVGGATLNMALHAAGFTDTVPVASQYEPDPAFPTVAFPNPEEPGAMDEALAVGIAADADAVLANDPDADRCAVAVRHGRGLRMLSGDELGVLLGWWIIARGQGRSGVFATSIVSSRLLGRVARAAGVPHTETLTGFKWIARTPDLRYGYEEALGYCVAPWMVRDKDGISAAVLAADMLATLKSQGRTAIDVLNGLAAEHGLYATAQWSVRAADTHVISDAMARLRARPPAVLAAAPVVETTDLRLGDAGLPPTDGVRLLTADASRVIVRPSGTEPKLKCYLEVVVPDADRSVAAARLTALRADIAAAVGLPA